MIPPQIILPQSCPLGEVWVPTLNGESLPGSRECLVPAPDDIDRPAIARIHSLKLGHMAWERDSRLPVYLIQREIHHKGKILDHAVELIFPLDPWDLGEVEEFCRMVHEAGFGLIPLPVAPATDAYRKGDFFRGPSWEIPNEKLLAKRATHLVKLQIEAIADWGQKEHPGSVRIDWAGADESMEALMPHAERLAKVWESLV